MSKYSDIITFDEFKDGIESLKKNNPYNKALDNHEEKLNLFYSIDKKFLQSEKDVEKLFHIFANRFLIV